MSTKGAGRTQFISHANPTVELIPSAICITVEPDKGREGETDLVLRQSMWKDSNYSETREKAIRLLHRRLKALSEDDFAAAFCKHEWERICES